MLGPRAPRCPPTKRLPTHSAVAAGHDRPASGWASLTPTERDVVRLVSEGSPTRTSASRSVRDSSVIAETRATPLT